MSIASIFVVFVISWWLILFMVLPFGVKPEQEPESGNMRGAPKNPNLKMKIIVTTIITIFFTIGYYFAVEKKIIVFGSYDTSQQKF